MGLDMADILDDTILEISRGSMPWLKEFEGYRENYEGLVPFDAIKPFLRYKIAEGELGAGFEALVENVFYGRGVRNLGGFTAEELREFVIGTDGFYGCKPSVFAGELGLSTPKCFNKIRKRYVYREKLSNGGDEHFLKYYLFHPALGVLAVELLRVLRPVGRGFCVEKGVFLFKGRNPGEIYSGAVADCIGLR